MSREELYREALGLPRPNWGDGPYGSEAFVFPTGTSIYKDIQISELKGGNDFQIFGETFERTATTGIWVNGA